MSLGYFDTTQLPLPLLDKAHAAAESQADAILEIYLHMNMALSPSQVWALCPCKLGSTEPRWPLTSVRRAMCVLTRRQQLERCATQVLGQYGRPEYQWRRVTRVPA